MSGSRRADSVVIGGGLHGLAAAWNLSRLGSGPVILIERFHLGHDRGSSHGLSRMCRSTYPSQAYVHLLQTALEEDWPRLEREAGGELIRKMPACFFGPPGGMFEAYARTMDDFGEEVEILSPSVARERYPQFRFEGMKGAIEDKTAGVIAAEKTLKTLASACKNSGVEIHERTRAKKIVSSPEAILVETDGKSINANRAVIAAGPWTSEILPFLDSRLKVVRQDIGYFALDRARGGPENFPPWVYLGIEENDFYYSLPDPARGGIKVARHITLAESEDPDGNRTPRAEALEDLRTFLKQHLTVGVESILDSETCLYTNTQTEDFVIDFHPRDSRIVFGAGFSGHGFKFGPLTGRILAELALFGRTKVDAFNQHRAQFSLTH